MGDSREDDCPGREGAEDGRRPKRMMAGQEEGGPWRSVGGRWATRSSSG